MLFFLLARSVSNHLNCLTEIERDDWRDWLGLAGIGRTRPVGGLLATPLRTEDPVFTLVWSTFITLSNLLDHENLGENRIDVQLYATNLHLVRIPVCGFCSAICPTWLVCPWRLQDTVERTICQGRSADIAARF